MDDWSCRMKWTWMTTIHGIHRLLFHIYRVNDSYKSTWEIFVGFLPPSKLAQFVVVIAITQSLLFACLSESFFPPWRKRRTNSVWRLVFCAAKMFVHNFSSNIHNFFGHVRIAWSLSYFFKLFIFVWTLKNQFSSGTQCSYWGNHRSICSVLGICGHGKSLCRRKNVWPL